VCVRNIKIIFNYFDNYMFLVKYCSFPSILCFPGFHIKDCISITKEFFFFLTENFIKNDILSKKRGKLLIHRHVAIITESKWAMKIFG
jgi:hypothetical protein